MDARELARVRREEFERAKQKQQAEEELERTRVADEIYAAKLAAARAEIATLAVMAEERFHRRAAADSVRWKRRESLRKLREECDEGAQKIALAILEGTSKQLAFAAALNGTRLREYPHALEAMEQVRVCLCVSLSFCVLFCVSVLSVSALKAKGLGSAQIYIDAYNEHTRGGGMIGAGSSQNSTEMEHLVKIIAERLTQSLAAHMHSVDANKKQGGGSPERPSTHA